MSPSRFMVIAHRGASAYTPENTFSAFDKALSLGVDQVELDVHFSSDGHVVVIHDDNLDRTSNGSGPVASHTLSQLRALDMGSWFAPEYAGERMPTLGQLLERYGSQLYFHIEIKAQVENLSQRIANLVREYRLSDSVTITSFQKARLEEIRAYAPELPAGWLVPEVSDSIVVQAQELGLTSLCPRADRVTTELVDALHGNEFIVRAWGVTDEALMRQVVDAGADGMTVNFPDKLFEYLRLKGVM